MEIERKLSRFYVTVFLPHGKMFRPFRQEDGDVKARELPLDFHLRSPYASSYEENYALHAS